MLVDQRPPTATARPVLVTEQRYACPWCRQSESWEPATAEHMERCPMRPEPAEVAL